MSLILELEHVSFNYQPTTPILEDISLQVHSSEVLGIIGPNGGGKTTLLNILLGQHHFSQGIYRIFGRPVDYKHFPFHHFGHVPQKKELNTLFPLTVHELLKLHTLPQFLPHLDNFVQQYQIHRFLHSPLSLLSGGQLQRVLIVRSLINQPAILLLDEPSTGLDSQGIDELEQLLQLIKQNSKQAIIIVDHNIKQILKYADRVLCLNKTYHWHDRTEKLSTHVLNSVYHCEFEHEQIHEQLNTSAAGHHHCHEHTPQQAIQLSKQEKK